MTREEMIAMMREEDERERERAAAPDKSDADAMREALRADDAGGESDAWYEDLGEGIVSSAMNTYYGAKDLVTDLTPEETARMKDWERDAGESGWGTAGRVVGEAAQLAVPGGLGVKVARGLAKAKKAMAAARSIPVTTDIAASAGHGALQYQDPEGDGSRLKSALSGGLAAGGGAVLGKALKPMVGRSMIRLKPEAEELIERGVYLSPGQAAESPMVRGAESVMEVTPFLARGAKKARARGEAEWHTEALKEVVPARLRDEVTETGLRGVRQIEGIINRGYDEAWGLVEDLPKLKLPQKAINRLAKKDRRVLNNVMEDIDLLREGGPVSARQIDKIIRDAMPTKASKRELRDALKNLRNGYRSHLPPEQRAKLAEMDAAWPKFLSVRRGAKNAVDEKGAFKPTGLARAANVIGRDAQAGVGRAPMQDISQLGVQTIGQNVGGQPLEWFRRMSGMAPSPPFMQGFGQYITGQLPGQRETAAALRRTTDVLSPYISPARGMAAFEESD